ncbi:MAG: hypothetical protein AB8B87_13175 [Granulosicoccus sp.]
MQTQFAEPLWDEGIALYLSGEYEKKQAPLTSTDLQHLANEQAVRVGDLLETLYLMAIYGAWHYCDEQGQSQELDEVALDDFYARGRIGPDDMAAFDGVWIPNL